MELHTCLWNEVAAFDFDVHDFEPIRAAFPELAIVCHRTVNEFLAGADRADYVLAWDFEAAWYARCPSLRAVLTPAAGNDWVEADPNGRVTLVHGTFHGTILGESLLGAILFMNHRMPAMIENFAARQWNRDLQQDCRLLRNQTVMIIGLGHIGGACAHLVQSLGARVIGIKRDPSRLPIATGGIDVRAAAELDECLPEADHLVLLLPGDSSTDRFLRRERLMRCKAGVYVYNFGRGNALASDDLIAAGEHIGGAFLDVVDEEPLPADSPLWTMDNVMITPHSSCIYREYKAMFIDEVVAWLDHAGA